MRKSKLGRIFLAAVLALTLGASSALAVEPTPAESYRNGTVTFQVSFDLEATDGLVTNAKAGKSQASTPYAPEFTGLTAYTTGINGTLKQFTEAVTTVSNIPSGDVYKESAIEALVRTMTLYGSIFNQTALKSAAKTVGYSGGTRFIDEYTTAATYAESDDKALKPFPATNGHYDIVEAIGRMNKAFAKAFVGQAYNASATAFTADEIKAMREQLATALAKADFGANNADGVNPALATMAIGEIITAVGSALAAGAS
ncbi:MAG: hypothetical protein IJ520_07085, partial [Synergistaceae bacterium]|nr:hypothetical protein [Synergistaceae bacterium]